MGEQAKRLLSQIRTITKALWVCHRFLWKRFTANASCSRVFERTLMAIPMIHRTIRHCRATQDCLAEIRPSEIRAIELAAPAVHRIPFGCETPQTRMGKIGFGKVTQITGSIAHLASMQPRAGEINAIKTRVIQNSLA